MCYFSFVPRTISYPFGQIESMSVYLVARGFKEWHSALLIGVSSEASWEDALLLVDSFAVFPVSCAKGLKIGILTKGHRIFGMTAQLEAVAFERARLRSMVAR